MVSICASSQDCAQDKHEGHQHCCACRTDSSGLDMNRLWNSASPEMEPALHSMLQQLQLYEDDPAHSLDMFVDLHGHSASRSHFLFCNPPAEGVTLGPEAHERLTRQGAGMHWVQLHLSALVCHVPWHTAQGSRASCLAGAGLQHVFTRVMDQHLHLAAGQGQALQHVFRCLFVPIGGNRHQLCSRLRPQGFP